MLRLTLGGENLEGFPEGQESGYVKLLFPKDGETKMNSGIKGVLTGTKPRMRSYTIRSFDPQALELNLDFVTHGDNGPASAWAMKANEGDEIAINGPGPTKLVDHTADWFFLAGDMSALPAISVNLEQLPSDARGYAVLEVIEESDIVELTCPVGIDVHWIINSHPNESNSPLADKVISLAWQNGRPTIWVAGEFNAMRAMRKYFKQDRGVAKNDIYASSYWKFGATDEGNKAAKILDMG